MKLSSMDKFNIAVIGAIPPKAHSWQWFINIIPISVTCGLRAWIAMAPHKSHGTGFTVGDPNADQSAHVSA